MSDNLPVIIEPKVVPSKEQELQRDLDYARKNQIEIIEQGVKGLDGIATVADQSQHPRAYEVMANYLKILSEFNKDLIDTSVKKNEVKKEDPIEGGSITNNLFVGTTDELQTLLGNKNKNV